MFYSTGILAKKASPLSKIWLAAHWSKKLTKQNIFDTDIEEAADAIITPTLDGKRDGKHVPLALRVSGHLLVGLCRIYQRKVAYLLRDCNDAETKIKMAAHHSTVNVDLDDEKAAGGGNDINVKEFGENFELENFEDGTAVAAGPARDQFMAPAKMAKLATARPEDITLQEDRTDESFGGGHGFEDYLGDQVGGQHHDDWDDDMGLDQAGSSSSSMHGDGSCVDVSFARAGGTGGAKGAADEMILDEDQHFDQYDDFDQQDDLPPKQRRRSYDASGIEMLPSEEEEEEQQQQPPLEVEDGDIEVQTAGGSKAAGGGAKKRKQAAAFDEDEPVALSDAQMKACIKDTRDITKRVPLRRRFLRIGEEDPLKVTMAQRFCRPTMQGLAPALMKMYEELMTPGMFPFAQAKTPPSVAARKRAAEEEPEEEGGADVTDQSHEGSANTFDIEQHANDAGEEQNDDEQQQQDEEQPYDFDQQDDFLEEQHDGRRRSSIVGEEEVPALEGEEETEEGTGRGSSGGKDRMHRHQRRFLRMLDQAFTKAKRDTPTFQKIVPKKSINAHDAARYFHELLVAKTKGWVDVQQDEPNGNIFITKVKKTFDRVIETEVRPAA